MTVSTAYAPLNYTGNGSTTVFSVTWPFFTGSLIVTLVSAAGVETVKTISTHYTVSGGTTADGLPATGSVTMLTAPASGETLRIARATPKLQSSTWTNGGAFQAKTVEATVDRLMLIAQEGGGSSGGGGGDPVGGDSMQFVSSGADPDYWDAEGAILRNLADPVGDTDAVSKGYADDHYGGAAAATAVAAAAAAASSATNAATSATNAASAWDDFDDRYLGSKASDPLIDNDGDAIETGALYWNSAVSELRVYNGSAWNAWAEAYAVSKAASRTELATLNPSLVSAAYLTQSYCSGLFRRVAYADYSTLVDADTDGIIAVRSTTNTAYAWLRDGAPVDGSYLATTWAMDTGDEADIGPVITRCKDLAIAMGRGGIASPPGFVVHIPPGTWNWATYLTPLVSGMTLTGEKGASRVVFTITMAVGPALRAVAVPASVPNYVYENIHVRGITFDSRSRPFKYWLSKADGTPVTDPEADYVMGTGALASGISGVDLVATLTSGKVTSVTINNGGSGWNGHATFPYLPSTVRLRFTGGNPKKIAYGYGTISGGTITSITIEYGGLGYTSTPTVTTAGGYADIALLCDASVDRRNNLGYTQVTDIAIQMVQVDKGSVTDCTFLGGANILQILGCRDFLVARNTFHDCTKPDCVNFMVTMGDYSTVVGDRNLCRDNVATSGNRVFAAMTCTGEQRLSNNLVEGCALLQAGTGTAQTTAGRLIVDGNTCRGVTYVNYGAHCMELIETKNTHFINNMFEDCDGQVAGMLGCKDLVFKGNTYRNICRDTNSRYAGFTSESERMAPAEGSGTMPQIFKLANADTPSCLIIANTGTVGAQNLTFEDETVLDNRVVSGGYELPGYLRWYRVGASSNNIAKNITVRRIKMIRPVTWTDNPDIPLFEPVSAAAYPDVMEAKMSLFVSDIFDRDGSGPKVVSQAISGTGAVTVSVGFRPSRMDIFAADSAGNGRAQLSTVIWDRTKTNGATYMGMFLTYENTAGNQYYAPQNAKMFSIVDNAGTELVGATLTAWTYTGFTMNVTTATITPTVYFVCYP